ncbi:hypothetical protein ASPZODRAFT_1200374 [Penicilliopsis zonata CBS 506.65]|uniref:ML-like domain-containing protein n=1 Tax=Penicilliopsis zonata CBS 506.65 TaxID=1073090 RepID=A0A1L9S843_9EURO|nr:hypothetical protein ASPZODRAFT_1200374 [Penicilliopsis zonata CBS 506.65]OJJ43310.1 hypothetical protein ASPZODRAFT_1200374 [Penicilliopsis zonata CBS 506.65]
MFRMRGLVARGATLLLGLSTLSAQVLASDTISTDGISTCMTDASVSVQELDVTYTRSTRELVFDVAGTSSEVQNVTATLSVTAYGVQVYSKTFDPCDSANYIAKLCPVPSGSFSANGTMVVPESYASEIPSIAFTIPDLEGEAKLELTSKATGEDVACIESSLTNGKSTQMKAVSYVAAGVAGAALAVTGLSALGAAGHPGASTSSPTFGDVVGWFHSMATNGMLSVSYPSVYRSFTTNFAFSTGLLPWGTLQTAIDNFRSATGGNLTDDSWEYLQEATLVYSDGSTSTASSKLKRAMSLVIREVSASVDTNSTSTSTSTATSTATTSSSTSEIDHLVSGIEAYAEELSIPQANTFMTVLLIFAIVIAAIAVSILLFKVILEAWALYGNFPQALTNFRKDYWGLLSRTITNLILLLYGVWVLYCIYQLTSGDSWAAKVLAVVTLSAFTGLLAFFSFKIYVAAQNYKQSEGDAAGLFENKDTWRKYSLFYDNYKKDYWWIFVPAIAYMFAKSCIIAAADGHGLVQSAGQLIVEALMLLLLLWNRPYAAKSGQWINITIQVVRMLSVACVLVFAEELGLTETTKTVTGIALIAVQSGLTALLAILIAVNAIILCCRENPHVRRRREAEKMDRDMDNLTPLDARASLLMDHPPVQRDLKEMSKFNFTGPYEPYRDQPFSATRHDRTQSTERLVEPGMPTDHQEYRSPSRESGANHDSRSHSPEPHHPTQPGYGMAL